MSMKIIKITFLAGCVWCVFSVVRINADTDRHDISGLRVSHRQGPSQRVGARWGWAIKAAAQGSIVLRTADGGRSWEDRTPRGFTDSAPDLNDGDVFASSFGLSALDSRRCWVAFGSHLHNQFVIIVERTADGGQHWRQAVFPKGADAVVLQSLDAKHGFLLALGGAGAGLMQKDFYSTSDGGKSWTRRGSPDLTGCNYYPNGMTFRNTREGWITGTNHGDPPAPLIRTRDGGRTWRVQPVALPSPYQDGGADTYHVRFHGKDGRRGAFTARLMGSTIPTRQTVNYVTRDGGEHWHIARPVRRTRQ